LGDLHGKYPDSTPAIDRLVNRHGGNIDLLRFVPAMQKGGPFAVILDAGSGDVIDMLMTDPWLE